jgi:hypothetical protein
MLKHRLGIKRLPNSIYKLTGEDKESEKILKYAVDHTIGNLNLTQTLHKQSDAKKKFEIKLTKVGLKKEGLQKLKLDNSEDTKSGTLIGD